MLGHVLWTLRAWAEWRLNSLGSLAAASSR